MVVGGVREAEHFCGVGEQSGCAGVVGGGDEVRIGAGVGRAVRRRRGIEPVAELKAGVPEVIVARRARRSRRPRPACSGSAGEACRCRRSARTAPKARRPRRRPTLQRVWVETSTRPMGRRAGRCRARTAPRQGLRAMSRRMSVQSNRNVAVGAKTWRSPVQPSRSSRCGQSVGTSTKLPRVLHTTLSWNLLSSALEQSNHPVRAHVGVADDGAERVGLERAWPAGHFGVSEAVHGEGRLVGLRAVTGEDVRVGGEGVAQRSRARARRPRALRRGGA